DRNHIKRRLREAYRLQKHQLQDNNGKKFALLFIVQGNQHPTYEILQKSVDVLLNRLKNETN
ncbi:MAG: ribonuclease P protein component, partial [Flavobacteriaceae bacterium]|nr:ribonuclease P protein component [Flavobacteriaceae bacterium]